MKKKLKSKTGVLADHKKVGSKFIPPMRQIGDFEFVNWHNLVIPELIWVAELVNQFDLARAAELALGLARSAKQALASQKHVWFAAASAYSLLNPPVTAAIVERMDAIGLLQDLKSGMRRLAAFYPAFPLRFLYKADEVAPPGDTELQAFKNVLSNILDRRSRSATFTQAHAVYVAFDTGMLKVAPDSILANFPAIEPYPRTDESRRIAAAISTTTTTLVQVHHKNFPTTWPHTFWNRGLELEGCEFE